MSVTAVARKDFQDAVRSQSLLVLSALFVLFAVSTTYAYVSVPEVFGGDLSSLGLVFFLAGISSLFVALTAIVVAYKAIAGERESGSMALMLGLPHRRRDVVLGKVLGRTAVLVVPILVGFAAATLLALVLMDSFALLDMALFVLVTILFALAYVSIVIGLSATTGATGRASALAVGFFFVFEILWDAVALGVVWVANGFSLPGTFPDWLFVVTQVSPSAAYTTALAAVIPDALAQGAGGAAGIDAFYGTPWLGVVMLAVWIVVPLSVGYYSFSRADL